VRLFAFIAVIGIALTAAACGKQGVAVPASDPARAGAMIFAERCSGCHTISAAGAQGSGNRKLRTQGPNFDQRKEKAPDVLFAIRNGGFSGAIMPGNIVAGDDAKKVAAFLDKYSGKNAKRPARPGAPQGQ